jgi:lipoprotein-releasing system permease protein
MRQPSASLMLALRYLQPRRSFLSVITLISIMGVAVGVLMLIVVRAVMMGFESDFRDTLIGVKPHILLRAEAQLQPAGSAPVPPPPDWPQVLAAVKTQNGVKSACPYVSGILYLAQGDLQSGTPIIALQPADAVRQLQKLEKHLAEGTLALTPGHIVLPESVAANLGLQLGDELSVYPDVNVNQAVRDYTTANDEEDEAKRRMKKAEIKLHSQKLKLSGTLNAEATGFISYLELQQAQTLFQLGSQVTGIAIETTQPENAGALAATLKTQAPGYTAELWSDEDSARLAAMRNEQIMMQFVLSIIGLVAAFSVMNTTITVTTQKRREIGILAALGARPAQIRRVFVLQSWIVGLIGTGLGLGLSLLVIWQRNHLLAAIQRLFQGTSESLFLNEIPAKLVLGDVLFTCASSLLLCLAAGYIPAWFAARIDPAKALRDS